MSGEQSVDDTERYRVEVGLTRTGVAIIDAESEEEAREKAKRDAKDGRVKLDSVDSFTNNVRSLNTESDHDGGGQ